MRTRIGFLVLGLSFCLGCDDDVVPPITAPPPWTIIPELAQFDIRYTLNLNGRLYVAVIDPRVQQTETINGMTRYLGDRGVIFMTSDAITWTKLRGFPVDIGPLASHGDTIYCLASDSIYRSFSDAGWWGAFPTPDRLRDPSSDGDIVFYGDDLLAQQTFYANALQTFRIHPDGSYEEVFAPAGQPFAGAKYFKTGSAPDEEVYLRPHWLAGGFHRFNGTTFTPLTGALSPEELASSPINSMAARGETLYCGFKSPGRIKYLSGPIWTDYTDTLPYSSIAYQVAPVLRTEPTAIAFAGDRMFVATQCVGVLEWKSGSGWSNISDGLVHGVLPGVDNSDLFRPVVFLEHLNGRLIAGYGRPGFGPWGGVGAYSRSVP